MAVDVLVAQGAKASAAMLPDQVIPEQHQKGHFTEAFKDKIKWHFTDGINKCILLKENMYIDCNFTDVGSLGSKWQ